MKMERCGPTLRAQTAKSADTRQALGQRRAAGRIPKRFYLRMAATAALAC